MEERGGNSSPTPSKNITANQDFQCDIQYV